MISAVRAGRKEELQKIYERAESSAKDLDGDFQKLIRIIGILTNENIRIFDI